MCKPEMQMQGILAKQTHQSFDCYLSVLVIVIANNGCIRTLIACRYIHVESLVTIVCDKYIRYTHHSITTSQSNNCCDIVKSMITFAHIIEHCCMKEIHTTHMRMASIEQHYALLILT